MIIVTAYNDAYKACGALCEASMSKYRQKYPGTVCAAYSVPADYGRAASWFKIELIRRLLPDHDYVLWLDADAMIVGDADLREVVQPATLNISKDICGINCGVMAWRNCDEGAAILEGIDSLHYKFANHAWHEQAALMSMGEGFSVFYQPKHIWNAYPCHYNTDTLYDLTPDSLIVHYPGMALEERAQHMREFELPTRPDSSQG